MGLGLKKRSEQNVGQAGISILSRAYSLTLRKEILWPYIRKSCR